MPTLAPHLATRHRPSVTPAVASLAVGAACVLLAAGAVLAQGPARTVRTAVPAPTIAPTIAPATPRASPPAVAAPVPSAPPDGPLPVLGGVQPVSGTITFYGRGYGHGVGMSQWGARGRALAGQTASTILAHYYQNTTISSVDPGLPVRVLLTSGYRTAIDRPASVRALAGPWTIDGLGDLFPPDATLSLWRAADGWQLTVSGADGSTLAAVAGASDVRLRPAGPDTRFLVALKSTRTNVYRGAIRLIGSRATAGVTAVNEVGLDDYLLGVLPTEMPISWPIEAVRAQVIAARTYAVKHLHPSSGSFDLYDDTRSQIYRGLLGEQPPTNAAVAETAGLVLVGQTGAVANTTFHSTGGGATENNEFVYTRPDGRLYVRPAPELRGASDRMPDGTPYDAASPSATWQTAPLGVDQFSAIVAADARTNVGLVTTIDLSGRGVSGRLIRVTLTGTSGTRTVSGTVFRTIFNDHRPAGTPALRSTLFDLAPIP